MSEKSSEFSKMPASVEASILIKELAGVVPVGTRVDEVIYKVSCALRWSQNRTKDIYYQNARRIDADEMDALRAAVGRKSPAIQAGERNGASSDTVVVDREYFEQVKASLADLHRKIDALNSRAALASSRPPGEPV